MTTTMTTQSALPMSKYNDDKAFGTVATSASFLSRVQLFTGSSPAIAGGQIGSGNFGIVRSKDLIVDLGKEFDFLPIGWRFKAMEFGEAVISVYNPESNEWKAIVAKAEQPNSGCSFGIEFLIWVPTHKEFVTLFFNSKTSRREAPNVKNLITPSGCKAGTIKSNLIKKGGHVWHGPKVVECSTPFELPDSDEMLEQATKFANPKESEIEAATPSQSSRPQ